MKKSIDTLVNWKQTPYIKGYRYFFFIALLIVLPNRISFADTDLKVFVGRFSKGNIDNWQNKQFEGMTQYKVVSFQNQQVLKAESHSSASGLFTEQRIDLRKTPYLNWRWRIENRLPVGDEQSKNGDDYSARVYVIVKGGWAFWQTKALNYVWARNSDKGRVWFNAYVGNSAMMIAIRSVEDKTETWYQEKRNVLDDLKQQYGTDIFFIDAVAIMTDTDSAKSDAVSYYGDIYFSDQ